MAFDRPEMGSVRAIAPYASDKPANQLPEHQRVGDGNGARIVIEVGKHAPAFLRLLGQAVSPPVELPGGIAAMVAAARAVKADTDERPEKGSAIAQPHLS